MDILTVQSRVTWGYVGNAAAVPAIQAMGVNAWPVDTVRLAHHPGHGRPWGARTPADEIAGLIAGARSKIVGPAAMLLGYLASAEQGDAALAAGESLTLYLDPAFGDDAEGVYVDPAIVAMHRERSVPRARVVMPNRFELAELSGLAIEDAAGAVDAARALIAQGPEMVLVSSVPATDGRIGNLLVTAAGAWIAEVPRLPLKTKGTGDLLSAAFAARHAAGWEKVKALQAAVGAVHAIAADAAERGLIEPDLPGLLEQIGEQAVLIPATLLAHDHTET